MQFLNRMRQSATPREGAQSSDEFVAPCPSSDVYVVGDVHGRSDLLEKILTLIDHDIEVTKPVAPQVVFVGDYVDRGEHSAEVLARLCSLDAELVDNLTLLMGNHEKMLLDFLDDPARFGGRWLRNGGLQTLASFGVRGANISESAGPDVLLDLGHALRDQMGKALEEWLRARPLNWHSGNVWVVHAAADPGRAMEEQKSATLLWGAPEFNKRVRSDGNWVVHGHTIVDQPGAAHGRISVDTGAVFTGHLTAAAIRTTGEITFLQT
jgi:serine/threonine protein phosphatase 1